MGNLIQLITLMSLLICNIHYLHPRARNKEETVNSRRINASFEMNEMRNPIKTIENNAKKTSDKLLNERSVSMPYRINTARK